MFVLKSNNVRWSTFEYVFMYFLSYDTEKKVTNIISLPSFHHHLGDFSYENLLKVYGIFLLSDESPSSHHKEIYGDPYKVKTEVDIKRTQEKNAI